MIEEGCRRQTTRREDQRAFVIKRSLIRGLIDTAGAGLIHRQVIEADDAGETREESAEINQTPTAGIQTQIAESGLVEAVPGPADALRAAVRIGEVQIGAGHRIPEVVVSAVSPITVLVKQLPLFLVFQTDQEVAAIKLLAPGQVDRAPLAAAMFWQTLIGADLQTVEIGRGDGVHHPGDRIRAIDRRGAVLQDFNALQHAARNDVQVSASAHGTARAGGRQAATVQHHQGSVSAQAAQRHGLDARPAIRHKA
ncbi:hypothetical protein D3C80_550040 [compost metagenome]